MDKLESMESIVSRASMRIFELHDAHQTQQLLEANNSLNSWKWNDILGEKPTDWDDMPEWVDSKISKMNKKKVRSKINIIHPLNERFEQLLTHKAIMRYHHMHNLGRTEQEFNDWWESNERIPKIKYEQSTANSFIPLVISIIALIFALLKFIN